MAVNSKIKTTLKGKRACNSRTKSSQFHTYSMLYRTNTMEHVRFVISYLILIQSSFVNFVRCFNILTAQVQGKLMLPECCNMGERIHLSSTACKNQDQNGFHQTTIRHDVLCYHGNKV